MEQPHPTTAARRGKRPSQGPGVIERAFSLLDSFTAETPALTLTQIAERSELPLSTAKRLCRQLVDTGALEQESGGRYTVGIRMLEYAALSPRGHGIRAVALPYMEDLHRAFRQHVQLAVREGEEVVFVERLSAPGAGRVLFHVGARVPLHEVGVGTVLLAHADESFRSRYISTPRRFQLDDLPVRPNLTLELLDHIRATGFGRFSRDRPEPADTVAAPIFDRNGDCVAAISTLGAQGAFDGQAVEPALVGVSRAISREVSRLGRHPQL